MDKLSVAPVLINWQWNGQAFFNTSTDDLTMKWTSFLYISNEQLTEIDKLSLTLVLNNYLRGDEACFCVLFSFCIIIWTSFL